MHPSRACLETRPPSTAPVSPFLSLSEAEQSVGYRPLDRAESPRQQPKDLESRLRNLEHLIASIPGGGEGQSTSLSAIELAQIRQAARPYLSPAAGDEGGGTASASGSGGMGPPLTVTPGELGMQSPAQGQGQSFGGLRMQGSTSPGVYAAGGMGSWVESGGGMGYDQGIGTSAAQQQPTFGEMGDAGLDSYGPTMGAEDGLQTQDQAMVEWTFDPGPGPSGGLRLPFGSMDAGTSSQGRVGEPSASSAGFHTAGPRLGSVSGHGQGQAQGYGQALGGGTEHAAKQTQGQDLMYTDAQGQTRFLGPSRWVPAPPPTPPRPRTED